MSEDPGVFVLLPTVEVGAGAPAGQEPEQEPAGPGFDPTPGPAGRPPPVTRRLRPPGSQQEFGR